MKGKSNKPAGKEKAGTSGQTPTDKALQAFAELIIKKMDSLSSNWQKPWIDAKVNSGPQNLEGRKYSGLNTLFLFLVSEMAGYKMPVFMTFPQAKKNGLLINKGEKAFPVIYFNFLVKDKETGKKISMEEWKELPKETQDKYTVIPFMSIHQVFNIEQSNIKEAKPELWESLSNKFFKDIPLDTAGMVSCPEMDLLLDKQGWVCPIYTERENSAFYSILKDEIHLPLKGQFHSGEAFYGTLTHEMAHSTGSDGRLARNFNDQSLEARGREELVAELTSAIVMASLGVSITPRQENVAYLKGWCQKIHKDPKFLLSTLSDVSKASGMILDVTSKYRLLLDQNKKKENELEKVEKQTYAPYEGQQLEFKFTELSVSESHESLTGKLLQKDVPSLMPGDFCMVQRVFDVSRHFEFTSGMTVETPQDVAYIFRSLEEASIENAFAVLVKNQVPVVLHLGMGHFNEVTIVSSPVKMAFDRIAADQVYFVHNHPSGSLKASAQDLKYWEQLKDVFGDKLMPGIIINLKSGKYGLFSTQVRSTQMEKRNVQEEIPLKVLSFSKQVFSPSYDPERNFVIHSAQDVAAFISSHRLGDREKISTLILNRAGGVVANVLTPYTQINERNTDAMAQYLVHTITVTGGATAILYGDFTMNACLKTLSREVKRYSFGDFSVTDAIAIKGNHSNHISALNECYLNEEKIAYTREKDKKVDTRQAEKEAGEFSKENPLSNRFTGKNGAAHPEQAKEAIARLDKLQAAIDLAIEEQGKIEEEWRNKMMDYIFDHYPTQATVSAEIRSEKGLRERELMKKDKILQKMNEEAKAAVDAAYEKVSKLIDIEHQGKTPAINSVAVENGNDAREINNSRMEQEFQKVDVSKINWKELNAKFGISKEMLEEKGVLEDMLNRKKSHRLLNVKYETVSSQKEFEARVAFREKEGGITLQFYPVRQTPPLDQPYHGYTFTEEDKRALLQTGHLGKVIEIQPYNKGKEQAYISLDPLTNDIVHLRKDRIKLKNEIGHVALTDQQKSELLEGRPVYIKDMTNREGKKFSAFVQIDADKKALAFLPASRVLIEHISEINGVPLNEEQKRMLKEGETVSLSGLQSRDGRNFSAKVSYNPEERKFKMDFPEVNKMDLTEEQKTALAAGEKVLLTGLISKNGKPYDMIVYQDKETGKIEKEWPVKDMAFKVKLSEEQKKELQNGRYVWIEGLQKKDGTTFKAPIKWNAKKGFFEFAQVAKKEQQTEKDKSQVANQAREETPRRGQRL